MATNVANTPGSTTYTPRPAGPFGTQGQQPDTGLMNQPREGEVAKQIERTTSKLPSDTFLWAAMGAVGASLLMRTVNKKQASLFLGQWVSPLLLFGVYNKLVKLGGSDRFSR